MRELRCPNCDSEMLFFETEKIIENKRVKLLQARCENCKFIARDVLLGGKHRPVSLEMHIKNPRDLDTTILFSSSSFVRMDPLGIYFGPDTNPYAFCGSLYNFLSEQISYFDEVYKNSSLSDEKKLARKNHEFLEKALNGELEFSLRIKDVFGNAFINNNAARKKTLSKKEETRLRSKLR